MGFPTLPKRNPDILQASDLASTSRIIIAIVTIAKESGDWSLLNEQVLLLSKKHGQLKQATTKMVQVVMGFLDDTPNLETKLSVIETLRTVTEGKVRHYCLVNNTRRLTDNHRSLSRSSELGLLAYCRISRKSKATSTLRRISYASFKWRRLVP